MTLDTTLPNGIRIVTSEPERGPYGAWTAHITISGPATFHFPGQDDQAEAQRAIHKAAREKFDR